MRQADFVLSDLRDAGVAVRQCRSCVGVGVLHQIKIRLQTLDSVAVANTLGRQLLLQNLNVFGLAGDALVRFGEFGKRRLGLCVESIDLGAQIG